MRASEILPVDSGEEREPGGSLHPSSPIHGWSAASDFKQRLGELEIENARLHRLVAELLIKNQQLRGAH
jgi:hypothetical protein